MSSDEFHTGKLRLVKEGLLLSELKEFLELNDSGACVDIKDNYLDSALYHYDRKNKNLYEFIEHCTENDEPYFSNFKKEDNGDISFSTNFYNGGTCLSEIIDEFLESEGV